MILSGNKMEVKLKPVDESILTKNFLFYIGLLSAALLNWKKRPRLLMMRSAAY